MPSYSSELADSRAIEKAKQELQCFSKNHKDVYFWLLNTKLIPRGEELVDDIFRHSKAVIFPVDTKYLENYLEGYKFNYIPFNNPDLVLNKLDGFWQLGTDKQTVKVWYNTTRPSKRQQYTKIHELIHFCQELDEDIKRLTDYLLTQTSMPKKLIEMLLDKIADKITAMYLMPRNYFIAKCRETTNIQELSDFFQVSPSSVRYRVKECGLKEIKECELLAPF